MEFIYFTLLVIQICSQPASEQPNPPKPSVYGRNGADWSGICAVGTEQSPIDIQVDHGSCDNSMVLDVQFDKRDRKVEIERLAYTVESPGNFSNLYATDVHGDLYGYTALQFHFHAPSEHYIDGKQFDFEMHIVHALKNEFKAPQRNRAVLGILFEINDKIDNPFFDLYTFSDLAEIGEMKSVDLNIHGLLGTQMDENPIYYTYAGSLTTSPCSEVVNWYVLQKVLPISSKQLKMFTAYFADNKEFANGNGNNRVVNELNGRVVKLGGVVCEEQFVYFFSFFILYIFINYFIYKFLF